MKPQENWPRSSRVLAGRKVHVELDLCGEVRLVDVGVFVVCSGRHLRACLATDTLVLVPIDNS